MICVLKKTILTAAILLVAVWVLMAQQQVSYRVLIDEQQVPKVVQDSFKTRYPETFMDLWYTSHITYWYEDYSQTWYGAWYPSRQMLIHKFEKPAYYEVEFMRNGETSRAIFSRFGQWFETRTKISSLPETVASSLKESEFCDWIWSDHKERIEAIGAPGSFYRLQVSNQNHSYILRINDSGEIIQVKYE
jgi:hypothetical protein